MRLISLRPWNNFSKETMEPSTLDLFKVGSSKAQKPLHCREQSTLKEKDMTSRWSFIFSLDISKFVIRNFCYGFAFFFF